ncbi:GTP 3',8-cyclase MoaA [Denitrificimonas sp. JX-1]|uniref:GTP 3',8-cyclase n=1 Tax=Denitrificimonas halotolerans TaxID=3098930 RepID=A0ABU5GPF1_9GAMM|nr:GTP 3',8-cyclase MoaA [Denitrificimonas sp. JX-1]MDY7218870.1 GTP 3',8-cyclase MoaA [Denitrificimonas sp. JX-1]
MSSELIDGFGRKIDYVRLSVTDRCDFRCIYCMAEDMTFLPRQRILTLEEIFRSAQIFVANGVRKIRLTGGEPLTRKGIIGLCEQISALPGLDELVMTTNGSQLTKYAQQLADAGVKRLNISLDSLCPNKFKAMTRVGNLEQVLAGIQAARQAGFTSVKINSVVIQGHNEDEIMDLTDFAVENELDITFIEEMPLGHVGRKRELFTSDQVRERITQRYTLKESSESTGGPAHYMRLQDHSSTRIGFISPHSHNFCSSCNRIRLTVEGKLLLCLGNEDSLDLLALLRRHPTNNAPVLTAIKKALNYKPEKHYFSSEGDVQIIRFMNASGG